MGKSSSMSDDGDDEPEDFPSADIEAAHFKSKYIEIYRTLQDTKAELDDFQASSKELEEELESELASTEVIQQELKSKITKLEGEKEEWKDKYLAAQKAHNLALGTLQRELDTTKSERDRLKVSLRDLEMGVDDLERNERMVSSSLQDVESRYNRAIEDKTMLEQELIGKQHLEEESQRLKDEIRDLTTEVSVLRQQRPRPSSTVLSPPIPSHLMSPVQESSQELSLSDLVMPGDTSFSDSSFASASSPNPAGSPTPYFPRGNTSPTQFSTFGVVSRTNSPSSSRLPLSSSPSQLPRSTTARILNGYTTDRSSSTSSPTAGPSRTVSRPLPGTSTGGRSVSSGSTETKGRAARMASDMGARVRTIQNRIQKHELPRSKKPLPGTAGAVPPSKEQGLAHPRMKALAGESGAGPGPGTPGTPGSADWVLVSEGEDSPSPAIPLPAFENGGRGGGGGGGGGGLIRKSTTQTFSSLGSKPHPSLPSTATTTLPSRKAIPSPLGAVYNSQTLPSKQNRPSSRLGSLSASTHASSRPTTPTFLPVPSSSSSSHIPRPASPALSQSSRGIAFPSSSSASGSTSSRPRVLGSSTSSSKHISSNNNPSSYTSSGDGSLRRSIRRISLDQSSLPPPQHSSSTRPGGPRTSFGSSSTNSRPMSAPVPPRGPPPVPTIPANFAKRQGVVGMPSRAGEGVGLGLPGGVRAGAGAMKVLQRKRSTTGAEGRL